MTRETPILRGYRTLLVASLVFGAGILIGHSSTQPVPVPVAQTAPATDQSPAAVAPTDAPVANLIALRSMDPTDQARFLSRMTDRQLVALQTVAVTTPNVLPMANDEALSRGLPELVAGGKNSFGAVQAVPVTPGPGIRSAPPSPDLGHAPVPDDTAPQVSEPCDELDCRIVSA